jgi:hypothetical protein
MSPQGEVQPELSCSLIPVLVNKMDESLDSESDDDDLLSFPSVVLRLLCEALFALVTTEVCRLSVNGTLLEDGVTNDSLSLANDAATGRWYCLVKGD